jgi:hypothetical protein
VRIAGIRNDTVAQVDTGNEIRKAGAIPGLEVEAVAQFPVNLPGIVVMKAAEGDAVMDEQAAIGDVERIERSREVFAETLAERQINRPMARQIEVRHDWVAGRSGAILAIGEAGAIVNVRGSVSAPGK